MSKTFGSHVDYSAKMSVLTRSSVDHGLDQVVIYVRFDPYYFYCQFIFYFLFNLLTGYKTCIGH